MRISSRNRLSISIAFVVVLTLCLTLSGYNKGTVNAATQTPASGQTNWTQFGYNAQHTGYNPKETILTPSNVSKLTLDWKTPQTGDVFSSIAVVNGVAYFGSIKQKFYALNATTGAINWSYPTQGINFSSPAVSKGIVYFGLDDKNLYALNTTTGKLIWRYTTGGAVSTPTIANGNVYFGSSDDKVYSLNATTGAFNWSYTTKGIIDAAPAVDNGVVYVGSNDAKLYALNAQSGAFIWKYTVTKTLYNVINSAPVVSSGTVYFGTFDIQTKSTKVYAVNESNGSFVWSYDVSGCGIDSSPTVANGVVYVGSDGSGGYEDGCFTANNANLFALNAQTGVLVWNTYIGGPDSANNSSPTVANGVLYVGSNTFDHTASGGYAVWYAINAQSGAFLWSRSIFPGHSGNGPTSSPNPMPVVVNGVFYISSGAYSGCLHAYHLPGTN